jgi:NADH:ubiquinone oxidoreductase subunit E
MADSNNILAKLQDYLKIDTNATTADGLFTLETTECLGPCVRAPGMSVDEAYYGKLDGGKIKNIIREYQNQKRRK